MNFNATSVKRGFGDLSMGRNPLLCKTSIARIASEFLSGTVLVVPGGRRSDGSGGRVRLAIASNTLVSSR